MKRERGYWKKWENAEKALKKAVRILGHFPNPKELRQIEGMRSLPTSLGEYHGGLKKARERMGYEAPKREPKSWNARTNPLWREFEGWNQHGTEKGYNGKKPTDLVNSKNGAERQWYSRGALQGWLGNFTFKAREKVLGRWGTQEEWKRYGVDHGYEDRNPKSLATGKIKDERTWLASGQKKGWLKDFKFKREKIYGRFKTKDEWIKHGMEKKYDERKPIDLSQSEIKDERSWYAKGVYEGWLESFDNKKKRQRGRWNEMGEWTQFGLSRGYDERNSFSLQKSEDAEERSWYKKGEKKKWITQFEFKRRIRTGKEFLKFIQQNQPAQQLAAASLMMNGEAHEVEKILVEVYEGRFQDQRELHALVQDNQAEINEMVAEGMTNLGSYLGDFALADRTVIPFLVGEALAHIPRERITASLEDKVFRVQRTFYGPQFNDNPQQTLEELGKRVESTEGKLREWYQRLQDHYQGAFELAGEL